MRKIRPGKSDTYSEKDFGTQVVFQNYITGNASNAQLILGCNLKTKSKPKNSKTTMKKILYILFFALTLATSFTACTEENVAPKTSEGGGNGGGLDPKS